MPVYRIFDREHILCNACHGEVLLKSGAAGVAGLPFWIVGGFVSHGVANRIMEDAWEYKGQRGHCARCNARVATAELIAATPDVEAQWEQEQSLQADQESLQVSQVLEGPQQDAVGDGQLTFQDCFA